MIELLPAGEQRDLARLELAVTHREQAQTAQDDERAGLLERAREELVDATREASLSAELEARMHEELADVLDLVGRFDDAIVALRSIGGSVRQPGAGRHHERIARLIAGLSGPAPSSSLSTPRSPPARPYGTRHRCLFGLATRVRVPTSRIRARPGSPRRRRPTRPPGGRG